jgi:hypothetical protein
MAYGKRDAKKFIDSIVGKSVVISTVKESLTTNQNMRYLDLSNQGLSRKDFELLIRPIAEHPNLKEVNFAGNQIGERAISEFFQALLKYNSPIEKVNFAGDGNALGYLLYDEREGSVMKKDCVVFAIVHNQNLKDVTLCFNPRISLKNRIARNFYDKSFNRKDLKVTIEASEGCYSLPNYMHIINNHRYAIEFIEKWDPKEKILNLSKQKFPKGFSRGFLEKLFVCMCGDDFDYGERMSEMVLYLDGETPEDVKQYCVEYDKKNKKITFNFNFYDKDINVPKNVRDYIEKKIKDDAWRATSRKRRFLADFEKHPEYAAIKEDWEESYQAYISVQKKLLCEINFHNIIVDMRIADKFENIEEINLRNQDLKNSFCTSSYLNFKKFPKLQEIDLTNAEVGFDFFRNFLRKVRTTARIIKLDGVICSGKNFTEQLSDEYYSENMVKFLKNNPSVYVSGLEEWSPKSNTEAWEHKQEVDKILSRRRFLHLRFVSKGFRDAAKASFFGNACGEVIIGGKSLSIDVLAHKIFPFIFDLDSLLPEELKNQQSQQSSVDCGM